jgi:hypothetical protein
MLHTAIPPASLYEVAWIEWQQLGGVLRNDSVDPPIWNATDSLTFHVVKRGI